MSPQGRNRARKPDPGMMTFTAIRRNPGEGGTMSEAKQKILDCADALGLTMTAEFVPWSQSRNKGEKSPSLNWEVTLYKVTHANGHGRPEHKRYILTTDYMAGCGHCPSYTQSKQSVDQANAVRRECETGRALGVGKKLLPDLADVLASLSSDAYVIDCPTYEEWASETGMDPDSRKGEAIYRQCLETALKIRAAIGEDGLRQLAEACQDY